MLNGYSSIPEENKSQAKRLSFNMLLISGIGCLVLTLVISLMGLSGIWSGAPLIFLLVVSLIYVVKYIKLGVYGGFSRPAVIVIGVLVVGLVIGVLVVGLVIGLLLMGNKEPEITITDQQMQISGIYGNDYNLADIESVTLNNESPVTTFKNNGFAMGGIKKGHFNVKDDGNCLLFVSGNGKCIRIKTKSDVIYINFADETATVELFNKLEKVTQVD